MAATLACIKRLVLACEMQMLTRVTELALQLPFLKISESMGNHDSKIVEADSVD
jgi:hypothetical protein